MPISKRFFIVNILHNFGFILSVQELSEEDGPLCSRRYPSIAESYTSCAAGRFHIKAAFAAFASFACVACVPDMTIAQAHGGAEATVAIEDNAAARNVDPREDAPVLAVPTFESIGLYWSPEAPPKDGACNLRYRTLGEREWKSGLPLWYDSRDQQCRGSLVHLQPDTSYEIEVSLADQPDRETLTARTWSEFVPIKKAYRLLPTSNTPLIITESGTPDGYILYTHVPGNTATIDVEGRHDSNVVVNASYVILDGLTLKNAATHAIRIRQGAHDVIVRGNDISGWGTSEEDGWGVDYHSAIYARGGGESQPARLIIEDNRIHHPRSNSNAWDEYRIDHETFHPMGPQGITLWDTAGNHVVRFNEIYSDGDHKFNDCVGGGENYSEHGAPNRDSDIYGNFISHCWDDGIEAEGANMNVRVWNNFIDLSFNMIAVAPTQSGPIYIWRNVADRSRLNATKNMEHSKRGVFLKTQSKTVRGRFYGGGRIYVFHNTTLQSDGLNYGVSSGLADLESEMLNVYSRNNIWQITADYRNSISDHKRSTSNDFDYDLFNGKILSASSQQENGIKGTPVFETADDERPYALDPSSPGYDAGMRIPNFNDSYNGEAPDLGAFESGAQPLRIGVDARDR
jgi:hypothetical protein